MITEIGITAGDIWHYLDDHRKGTLKDVQKGIGKPKDLILMSIGWLAREGHVIVEKEGSGYNIQLRK